MERVGQLERMLAELWRRRCSTRAGMLAKVTSSYIIALGRSLSQGNCCPHHPSLYTSRCWLQGNSHAGIVIGNITYLHHGIGSQV